MKKTTILIGLLLTLFSCQESTTIVPPTLSAVLPPLGDVIPFEEWEIDVRRDTLITLETGTYLKVPRHCFVDSNGLPITEGSVKIKFREFRDAADIFLSGIPMKYQGQYFESAGMCELKGEKGIRMAAGKSVEIGMKSYKLDDDYRLYALNEGDGEWSDIGQDSMLLPEVPENESDSVTQIRPQDFTYAPASNELVDVLTKELSPLVEPVKPIHMEEAAGYWVIQLEIDNPKSFPELSEFDGVQFKVIDGKQNQKDAAISWYLADLERASKEGQYNIHFEGLDDSNTKVVRDYRVEPVYKGEDYNKAMKVYETKFNRYKKEQVRQKKLAEERRIKYRSDSIKAANKWKADSAKWAKQWREDSIRDAKQQLAWEKQYGMQTGVQRVFYANTFGVYNCDRFYNAVNQKTRPVVVHFEDIDGKKLRPGMVYVLDRNRNAVLTISPGYAGTNYPFEVYDSMDLQVAVVTQDQRLATASNVQDVFNSSGEVKLIMQEQDVDYKDEEALKRVLL